MQEVGNYRCLCPEHGSVTGGATIGALFVCRAAGVWNFLPQAHCSVLISGLRGRVMYVQLPGPSAFDTPDHSPSTPSRTALQGILTTAFPGDNP